MSARTPGPWHVHKVTERTHWYYQITADDGGTVVAIIYPDVLRGARFDDRSTADADAIAALPTMLEEAEKSMPYRDLWEATEQARVEACNDYDTLRAENEWLREALAAIVAALEDDDDHRIHVATPVGIAHKQARAALAGKGGGE